MNIDCLENYAEKSLVLTLSMRNEQIKCLGVLTIEKIQVNSQNEVHLSILKVIHLLKLATQLEQNLH